MAEKIKCGQPKMRICGAVIVGIQCHHLIVCHGVELVSSRGPAATEVFLVLSEEEASRRCYAVSHHQGGRSQRRAGRQDILQATPPALESPSTSTADQPSTAASANLPTQAVPFLESSIVLGRPTGELQLVGRWKCWRRRPRWPGGRWLGWVLSGSGVGTLSRRTAVPARKPIPQRRNPVLYDQCCDRRGYDGETACHLHRIRRKSLASHTFRMLCNRSLHRWLLIS